MAHWSMMPYCGCPVAAAAACCCGGPSCSRPETSRCDDSTPPVTRLYSAACLPPQVKECSATKEFLTSAYGQAELGKMTWQTALSSSELAAALCVFRLLDFNGDAYLKLEDLRKAQVGDRAAVRCRTWYGTGLCVRRTSHSALQHACRQLLRTGVEVFRGRVYW